MATGAERAYEAVRAAILEGEFRPGDKLAESSLAQRLDLSRTPVREALRRLSLDGLVEIEANRGARVIRWDADDLGEVFALRAVLESHAAGRAAELRTDEQLARIERALTAMDALGDRTDPEAIERRSVHNAELHDGIVEAARSPRLPQLLQQLVSVNAIARNFGQYSPAELERSQRQHHDIVSAIRRRNAELARAAMTTHLLSSSEVLADLPEDGG
ncbi:MULTISPECIES: GntR family transcriptional regulator [unclassified Pseudonocardia]|uniref:GntR family transcriptional regulator n=1 Tax=unclassified Pseudonocardia TaxID=2619320 RepID=UPI0001FFF1A8|nr:GntR family transcriptional regulator [Pseudonocardia sp. Ae707_Ps1]OLM17055.1 Transcriptional regulator, GntR family [Pseudonocardia sp. Ae707_Ps1]